MSARWQWILKQIGKRLWFRASLFSLLGVVSALLALAFKDYRLQKALGTARPALPS